MTTWDSSEIEGNLDDFKHRVKLAAGRGLKQAAEHILGISDDHVPHEEGTLERSGHTNQRELRAVVFYDGPYAVRQHEELTYRHDAGRTAKFLENAFNSERDTVGKIITTQVRRVVEGG